MKKWLLTFFFLLCVPKIVFCSTESGNIKGYIKDKDSGEALPYANVSLKGTNKGTTTNDAGYFILINVPVGEQTVNIHYIGYKSISLNVEVKHDQTTELKIEMAPTVINVQGVTVTANAEMLETSKKISQIKISPRQISSLPSIGETDVFRTLQLLPGISAVNEGSSGLYVRGGTPDQNLVLFDGMKIYHVDHFFGFFSAFNADAIQDIQLLKGGFPAQYGGRISSVVKLTGKTGHQNKTQFGYGANLLSAHAKLEIPLKKYGTFLITGRRSYTDFIQSPLYDDIYGLVTGEENGGATGMPNANRGGGGFGNRMQTDFRPSFYFYDLNSKLSINLSPKDILTFSFYSGKDYLDKSQDLSNVNFQFANNNESLQTDDFTKWGNLGFSSRWARQWNERLHIDFLFAASKYFSEYDKSSNINSLMSSMQNDSSNQRNTFSNATSEDNTVTDTSFKIDADWQISSSHRLGFGLDHSLFHNSYIASRDDTTQIFNRDNKTALSAFYLQDNWDIKSANLLLGLRSSYYENTEKIYYEPRFSLSIPISKKIKLKSAWGQYYQFINQISNEDVTQGARDFWLLADNDIKPCFSEHYILGLYYEIPNYVFSIEGYYKELNDIIEFSRRHVSKRSTIENFFVGNGKAKGIEFLVQKKRGTLTGWLGYTLGKVDYHFPEINNGLEFPAEQDRRHEINFVTKYTLGVYTFAATWVYASGNAYTAPESQYSIDLLNGDSFSYIHVSDKNANRLPAYHRLDLSASRKFESAKWKTEIGLSIFNVYNRKNVWYKDYNLDTLPITITDVNFLGLTPTIYIQMDLK